jgi:LysM repeat protein
MVSNQALTHSRGTAAAIFAGVALALAGCQTAPVDSEPAATVAAPAATAPAPDNAIEAAIARAGTEPASTAPVPELNPSAPLSYTVKRGDTLWDISAMFLRDPWLWPEIWHVNPTVANPHLIYPGDVLTLAYGADGRPQVTLTRGDALRVQPLVRTSPLDGPIGTIPYDAIKAFLGRPGIVSKEDLRDAPRVAALRDRHLVGSLGLDVYAKGLEEKGPGRYSIVRVGDELKDPENGKVLGYMGHFAAIAEAADVAKVTRATLVESTRETEAGDLLFAEEPAAIGSDIVPHAGPADFKGQIIAVVDGVSMIGQYHVVAINRGSKHGLESGHVLAIDQKGEVIADGSCKRSAMSWCVGKSLKLPDERAGTLLVFKTYEAMSYGLIVSTTTPVRVADRVRAP